MTSIKAVNGLGPPVGQTAVDMLLGRPEQPPAPDPAHQAHAFREYSKQLLAELREAREEIGYLKSEVLCLEQEVANLTWDLSRREMHPPGGELF